MISFDISGELKWQEGLLRAPIATYFWIRAYFEQVARLHRQTFKQRARGNVDFTGRNTWSGDGGGLRIYDINEPVESRREDWIRYQVRPEPKRTKDPLAAEFLRLDIYSHSILAKKLQETKAIKPRRVKKLAIPLDVAGVWGKRKPWPFMFRRDNPRTVLLTRTTKRGNLVLFERVRKAAGVRKRIILGKKGQPLKRQRKTLVDQLVPRWVLIDVLKLKRSMLQFYESWTTMQSVFDRVWDRYIANLWRDIDRGVLT